MARGAADLRPPQGAWYTQTEEALYLHLPYQPAGDIILPELNGKVGEMHMLSDKSEVAAVTHWGSELLLEHELRIRPRYGLDWSLPKVVKIPLK